MPSHAHPATDRFAMTHRHHQAHQSRPHWLRLYVAAGYALLVIYASLYPLTGWSDAGISAWDFVAAGWPRYYTVFDIATNVLAYLPLGFFLATVWPTGFGVAGALLASVLLGSGISFSMELIQNFLPSRVPSNLDWGANSLGAFLGALLGMHWGRRVLDGDRLLAWRERMFARGPGVDFGLILMAAWLLTQLSLQTLPFGSGNLRLMLELPAAQPFSAERFVHVEGLIAATGILAAGLMTTLLLRRHARSMTIMVFIAALTLKTLAYALLMAPELALSWVTPGSSAGIGIGFMLWFGASFLVLPLQRALAALALLLVAVSVNLAPDNPYLENTLQLWNPGQFLNFNGLTRLICSLWPFLALPWLMIYRPDKHEYDD